MRNYFNFIGALALLILPSISWSNDIPVKARFFAGAMSLEPKNLNDVTQPLGLKKIDAVAQYGFEATFSTLQYLDLGVRYTKRVANQDEDPVNYSTDYYTKLDQDSVLLLARVPFLKTDIVRLDGFVGFGGTNTTLKIKSATQEQELTRKAATGWFASPYTAVGGSLSIGFKRVFVILEGGLESNKVDSFERSNSTGPSIDSLDLSGSYFSIGLLFDGIPASIK